MRHIRRDGRSALLDRCSGNQDKETACSNTNPHRPPASSSYRNEQCIVLVCVSRSNGGFAVLLRGCNTISQRQSDALCFASYPHMASDIPSFRFLDAQVGQRILAYSTSLRQEPHNLAVSTHQTDSGHTYSQTKSHILLTTHPLG